MYTLVPRDASSRAFSLSHTLSSTLNSSGSRRTDLSVKPHQSARSGNQKHFLKNNKLKENLSPNAIFFLYIQ